MKKTTLAFLGLTLGLITLTGCTGPCKFMTVFNYCPHERSYLVYGRVVDLECNPVENCKIILIKRKFALLGQKNQPEDLGQYHVALTDKTGDYSFCFEPLKANDVWLYFDAGDKGYAPQFVELNHLMGPTFLQTSGNSPIIVDMTLEKAM